LRESVVRDLAWLLNTQNLKGSPEMRGDSEMKGCQNMDGCTLAEQSVINYGIPPLSGLTASGINLKHLINSLTEAIRNFEPRLIRDTIQVTARRKKSRDSPNTLDFIIEAQLWSQPLPIHLMLVTSVDLETGHIALSEKDDE
jgi:type VI secretion system protein ImpF